MAISINLTLFIQIAHFVIAYALISKFLLKPGYAALKSDHERTRQLKALVAGEQEKLAEKQEYKKRRWQLCQNYFYANRPTLRDPQGSVVAGKTLEPEKPLSDAEVATVASDISKALKEKVLHG